MKCKEWIRKCEQQFKQHGNARLYSVALENMQYVCEDYKKYINNLPK